MTLPSSICTLKNSSATQSARLGETDNATSIAGTAPASAPTYGTKLRSPEKSASVGASGTPSQKRPAPTSSATMIISTSCPMNQSCSVRAISTATSRPRSLHFEGNNFSPPARYI